MIPGNWKKHLSELFRANGRQFVLLFILPITIFYGFETVITNTLTNQIVAPFLSKFESHSLAIISLIAILVLSLSLPTILKIVRRKIPIPFKWFCGLVTVQFIYFHYRFDSSDFDFYTIYFANAVAVLDMVFLPLAVISLFSLAYWAKRLLATQAEALKNEGFEIDEPIISFGDDVLKRKKFTGEIYRLVMLTESPNGSFPIGIVARWGSGKTSFLNSLIAKFDRDSIIVIELNVWKSRTANQIIDNFFQQFIDQLSEESFTLNRALSKYSDKLLKGFQSDHFAAIRNIADFFTSSSAIENDYDEVNTEIRKLGKKIVVVIDDIDRLDHSEVNEVLRLIRNTANFSNTFFLVAYDRNYLFNALNGSNKYRATRYLEKIFQLEFTLPPISNEVLQTDISNKLKKILSKPEYESYLKFASQIHRFDVVHLEEHTSKFIESFRDTIRFTNSLNLSYQFIKNEMAVADFYRLELLRYRHPSVFNFLYDKRELILDAVSISSSTGIYEYSLKTDDKRSSLASATSLFHLLKGEQNSLHLTDTEINDIVSLMQAVFPIRSNTLISIIDSEYNEHLTVRRPAMLDRYFTKGIEGRLSETTFTNFRLGSRSEFFAWLVENADDKSMVGEIISRLQAVTSFEDRRDFEQIVEGILTLANTPTSEHSSRHRSFVNYNNASLARLIGRPKNALYYGSPGEYKNYLTSLLRTNHNEYKYTNDFVSSLLEQYRFAVEDLFSIVDLSALLFDNFYAALKKAQTLNLDLWSHFIRCSVPAKFADTRAWEISAKARRLMRQFVIKCGLDDFTVYALTPYRMNETIGISQDSVAKVFGSVESFIRVLYNHGKQSPKVNEYLSFYTEVQRDPTKKLEGVPREFFQEITVGEFK